MFRAKILRLAGELEQLRSLGLKSDPLSRGDAWRNFALPSLPFLLLLFSWLALGLVLFRWYDKSLLAPSGV